MRTTLLLAAIAMLASAPVLAGEREDRHERQQRTEQTAPNGFDHGMHPVAHNAGPGERAHGWRYFSDPEARRAWSNRDTTLILTSGLPGAVSTHSML